MRKIFAIFAVFSALCSTAWSATRDAQLTNTTPYNYNYMYPYMNNQMRTNLNPGVITSQSLNPINTVVKTKQISEPRRVVPRTSGARTATTARIATSNTTRAVRSRPTPSSTTSGDTTNRRVVARASTNTNPRTASRTRTTSRDDITSGRQNTSGGLAISTRGTEAPSSTRCLADYSECMDRYCVREETKYNRCYCSAKLSQIDSRYQPSINELVNKIITVQTTNRWTDDEMNEYWMNTVGKYSNNTSSWTNLDNALDIDWASTDSRVRGQNAFATGHEYCVQYLRGCEYMSSNLRDAYRSEINRDCATYEQYLQNINNAAESIVKAYQ